MTDLLHLEGLSAGYGEARVLTSLSLSLQDGQSLALLGRNGTGKTTLIKCALGLIRPQAGEIRVLGEPAWTLSAAAKAKSAGVASQ